MTRPFELTAADLRAQMDAMVAATAADLQSQFLVLPKGPGFVDYGDFQDAYEVLRRHTGAFSVVTEPSVWSALREDALVFVVLRTILGFSAPEWAELARSDRGSDVHGNYARGLDSTCRTNRGLFASGGKGPRFDRTAALVAVAIEYIGRGAPAGAADTVHRMSKVDTDAGVVSLRRASAQDVPYAVLLYERYLGRPYASHRDSVSSLVGDVMEGAIEERLARARIGFRKTGRAEKIWGLDQAPDFIVPDEYNPAVVIEAKIASDDGTARDKVTRILRLAQLRDDRVATGQRGFEVVACVDGRGFGVRREDMRRMLESTDGKVFTLATLDQLIPFTRLREFLPRVAPADT